MPGSPPFGKNAWDVYLSQERRPLGSKLRYDVTNRNAFQASQRAPLGMRDIVISIRQKAHSHEAACRRASDVGNRECVVSGIGFIDEDKGHGMKGPNKGVRAAGRNVARIFMQGNLSQELPHSIRGARHDLFSIPSPESSPTVLPLAWIAARRVQHVETCSEWGKNEILRTKILMDVDLKLVFRREALAAYGRRQNGNDARITSTQRRRLV